MRHFFYKILLGFLMIAAAQQSLAQCSNPIGITSPVNVSGINVTFTTSGSVVPRPSGPSTTNQCISNIAYVPKLYLGNSLGGSNTGSITFTFSQPVNNVEMYITTLDNVVSTNPERATITTNTGTPALTDLDPACSGFAIVNNTVTKSASATVSAQGIVRVTRPLGQGFTTLTVSHTDFSQQDNGGGFTLCGASITNYVLPVSLVDYEVHKSNDVNSVKWATVSELNNAGFYIERSDNGADNWKQVGFVPTSADGGKSSARIDYRFTDYNPAQGRNFYRLKQMDHDEKFEYSTVLSVAGAGLDAPISIHPNPAYSHISLKGLSNGESLHFFDITGRMVKKVAIENANTPISISDINDGVYNIIVKDRSGLSTSLRLVIQK